MPTRKQRRRQQKARRHDYEFVYVDEEGNEVEAGDEADERPQKRDRPAARGRGSTRGAQPLRKVQPPSWQRVWKRGLVFGPVMFVAIAFLSKGAVVASVAQTAFMLAFFLPFSYLMDRMVYRMYLRRGGEPAPTERGGRRTA